MTDEIEIGLAIGGDAPLISALVTTTIRISNSADYPASVIERVIGNFSPDAMLRLMDSRIVWIVSGVLLNNRGFDGHSNYSRLQASRFDRINNLT
ncbi:hypothetical protein [Rhizobium leguminosarum]|uniref:hypothetical protein n=1 Tax=Rhizobium leguminosarum TaxID=384 RepID=UPI0014419429|nr:hypothetical protein [Rhizobium leguminosarum]NKK94215.1 hypothetical protein [Rhizobium leguminosarum bv. viciae]